MKPQLRFHKVIYLLGVLLVAGLGLAALIFTIPAAASRQSAQVTATTWLDGPSGEIAVNEEITVSVRISDVVGLYGIEFSLNFTPTDLQVIDAELGTSGVQIAPADCPKPDLKVRNVVSNTAGTIEYVVSQWNPTPPYSGDCDVAHIRFKTLQEASTLVDFANLLLSDKEGIQIPANAVDLTLEIKKSDTRYVYLPTVIK